MARVKTADIIAERDDLLERNIELASLLDAAEQRVAKLEEKLNRRDDTNDNLASSLVDARLEANELANAAVEFTELLEEAVQRIDVLADQRQYLSQVLLAISFYGGADASVPVNLATAAIPDSDLRYRETGLDEVEEENEDEVTEKSCGCLACQPEPWE